MMFEEDPPPVWFDQEVRMLASPGGVEATGVVRGVSRPWRGSPWTFAIEVDGEPDLAEVPADRLVPTGWFRDADGARLTAEEHERATGGRVRPGDRLRRRHATLTVHVVADDVDQAAARTREVVAALGLAAPAVSAPAGSASAGSASAAGDARAAAAASAGTAHAPLLPDHPVEYWKSPGAWVVVTEVPWPEVAGDDAEVAIAHLTAATAQGWGPVSGTPAGCDAVWDPGTAVGPAIPHVTWMALDGVA